MKNNLIALLSIVVLSFTACGPSAEEIAAEQQRVQDSIAEVQRLAEEAMAMEQQRILDSTNAVIEQMRMDSIAMAEEMAKVKKGASKPKAAPKKEEPKPSGVTKGGNQINQDGSINTGEKPKVTKGGQPIDPK